MALLGTDYDQTIGQVVAGAGDINDDGLADVFIGSRIGFTDGLGYVVFGASSGLPASMTTDDLDGTNGFSIAGLSANDKIGASFDAIGDVSGDGIDDFVIGAPNQDTTTGGSAYVVFGNANGFGSSLNLSALNGTNGFRIIGEDGALLTGGAVSNAGDVNGDGINDLIIGASDADKPGAADVGAAYIVLGQSNGYGSTIDLGAINDDGFDDIIVGAPASNAADGAAYVIYGATDVTSLSSRNYSGLNSDFDGNGFDDILFFNGDTRTVGQFVMDGASWAGVGSAGTGWAARGTGIMDGDDDNVALAILTATASATSCGSKLTAAASDSFRSAKPAPPHGQAWAPLALAGILSRLATSTTTTTMTFCSSMQAPAPSASSACWTAAKSGTQSAPSKAALKLPAPATSMATAMMTSCCSTAPPAKWPSITWQAAHRRWKASTRWPQAGPSRVLETSHRTVATTSCCARTQALLLSGSWMARKAHTMPSVGQRPNGTSCSKPRLNPKPISTPPPIWRGRSIFCHRIERSPHLSQP